VTFIDLQPAAAGDFAADHDGPDRRYAEAYPDVLRLRFTTMQNLSAVGRAWNAYTSYMTVAPCPFDDDITIDTSGLTYRGHEVALPAAPEGHDSGPYEYSAYFRDATLLHHHDWPEQAAAHEPLPETPADLCFKVTGPGFLTRAFDSNIAIIPKEALTQALSALETRSANAE
jgi:hypothetical protein